MGVLVDRIHRELTADEIEKISDTYHAWRSNVAQASSPASPGSGPAASRNTGRGRPVNSQTRTSALQAYADEPGFYKSVKLEEIKTHNYVLTPGRYVGAADMEDDGEPFEQRMKRLTATLEDQFAESAKLEKAIRQNLKNLSHA